MGKQPKQQQTIFLGSKITADGGCSYEIKKHLLLGRKGMTNLDHILKSRDIRWMKEEPIIQSEVSQKDKEQYSILTHMYGI